MSVTKRIFGGFSIVLLLLITVALTAFISVNNINKKIIEVTETSLPILATTDSLFSTLLRSQLTLSEYYITAESKTEAQ